MFYRPGRWIRFLRNNEPIRIASRNKADSGFRLYVEETGGLSCLVGNRNSFTIVKRILKWHPMVFGIVFGFFILSGPGFSQGTNQGTVGTQELIQAEVKTLSNLSLSEESIKAGKEMETVLRYRNVLDQLKLNKNWSTSDFQRSTAAFHSKGTNPQQVQLSFFWGEIKKIQKGHDETKKPAPIADPPEKAPLPTNRGKSLDPKTGALVSRLYQSLASHVKQADNRVSRYQSALQTTNRTVETLNTSGIATQSFVPELFSPLSFVAQQVPFVPQSFVPSASGKTYDEISLPYSPNLDTFLYKVLNIPQSISEKEYDQANSALAAFYQKIQKIVTSDGISVKEKKLMQIASCNLRTRALHYLPTLLRLFNVTL